MSSSDFKIYSALRKKSGWEVDNVSVQIAACEREKGNIVGQLQRRRAVMARFIDAYRDLFSGGMDLKPDVVSRYFEYLNVLEQEITELLIKIKKKGEEISELKRTIESMQRRSKVLTEKVALCQTRDQVEYNKKLTHELEELFIHQYLQE